LYIPLAVRLFLSVDYFIAAAEISLKASSTGRGESYSPSCDNYLPVSRSFQLFTLRKSCSSYFEPNEYSSKVGAGAFDYLFLEGSV